VLKIRLIQFLNGNRILSFDTCLPLLSLAVADRTASYIEEASSGIVSVLYGYIPQVSNLEWALQ
jgi:hypothetical protein